MFGGKQKIQTAAETPFDDGVSGMGASDLQEAVDMIVVSIDDVEASVLATDSLQESYNVSIFDADDPLIAIGSGNTFKIGTDNTEQGDVLIQGADLLFRNLESTGSDGIRFESFKDGITFRIFQEADGSAGGLNFQGGDGFNAGTGSVQFHAGSIGGGSAPDFITGGAVLFQSGEDNTQANFVGSAEVWSVEFVDQASGDYDGTHFTTVVNNIGYYIWFNLDGGSVDPDPGSEDLTGLQIPVVTGQLAATIAATAQAVVDGFSVFSASVITAVVTVTNQFNGNTSRVNVDSPLINFTEVTPGVNDETRGGGNISLIAGTSLNNQGGNISIVAGLANDPTKAGDVFIVGRNVFIQELGAAAAITMNTEQGLGLGDGKTIQFDNIQKTFNKSIASGDFSGSNRTFTLPDFSGVLAAIDSSVLLGGIEAGGDLILQSTTHATKGLVGLDSFTWDEANQVQNIDVPISSTVVREIGGIQWISSVVTANGQNINTFGTQSANPSNATHLRLNSTNSFLDIDGGGGNRTGAHLKLYGRDHSAAGRQGFVYMAPTNAAVASGDGLSNIVLDMLNTNSRVEFWDAGTRRLFINKSGHFVSDGVMRIQAPTEIQLGIGASGDINITTSSVSLHDDQKIHFNNNSNKLTLGADTLTVSQVDILLPPKSGTVLITDGQSNSSSNSDNFALDLGVKIRVGYLSTLDQVATISALAAEEFTIQGRAELNDEEATGANLNFFAGDGRESSGNSGGIIYLKGGNSSDGTGGRLKLETGTGESSGDHGDLDIYIGTTLRYRFTETTFKPRFSDTSLGATESKFENLHINDKIRWSTNEYIDKDGNNIDYGASVSHTFQVGGANDEVVITANTITFNNGGTNTGIDWATDAQFDIQIGGTTELAITATEVTLATNNLKLTAGQMWSEIQATKTPTGDTSTTDWDEGNFGVLDLGSSTDNVTLTLNNPQAGGVYYQKIIQHDSFTRNVIWPAAVKWENSIILLVVGGANAIDLVKLVYDGTSYLASFKHSYS